MPITNNRSAVGRIRRGEKLARTARVIALLIAGSCCAFALGAKPDPDQPEAEVSPQKPKNVHKQSVTPKQRQQQSAPKGERSSPASEKEETTEPAPKKTRTKPAPAQNEPALSEVERDEENTAPSPKARAKKVPANIEKIRAQHQKFQAKPSSTIATTQFNPEYRITAARNWEGAPYEIFRAYQPQWHDQAWYQSRYNQNLQLIAGGWYLWEAGYWLPAWGYDESAAYYPYDGPIYVGGNPRPFDQVVAEVQTVLQRQGYYRGEVDGLLGPVTQDALAAYQTANRLPPTQTIDEPTLQSFGLDD
jgi:Putative peptidoglycan binding domain